MDTATPASEFDIIIVSPDRVIFEGKAQRVLLPSVEQEIAILPDHTPLYAEVKTGNIQVTGTDSKVQNFEVEAGIIRVKHNKVSIILGFQ